MRACQLCSEAADAAGAGIKGLPVATALVLPSALRSGPPERYTTHEPNIMMSILVSNALEGSMSKCCVSAHMTHCICHMLGRTLNRCIEAWLWSAMYAVYRLHTSRGPIKACFT